MTPDERRAHRRAYIGRYRRRVRAEPMFMILNADLLFRTERADPERPARPNQVGPRP